MKLKVFKQNFTTVYLTVLVIIFSLQGGFIKSPIIKYADEIFALYAMIEIVINLKKLKKDKKKYRLLTITVLMSAVIVFVGAVSNIFSNLVNCIPILIDIFGMIKLPIGYMYVLGIVSNKNKKIVLNNLEIVAKVFVLIVFVCGIINSIYDIGMSYDIRYGLRSYTFLYTNPGGLNGTLFVAYSVICATTFNKEVKYFFEGMVFFSVLMTLRGSGIGVIGVLLMLKMYNYFKKLNKPISVKKLIPVGIGAVILAWNQIMQYFIKQTSLRSLMLRNAIVVFKRYFPLGAGFATYGSDQAFKNYSRLYYEFGYNDIHMLNRETGRVANDNFWPMILAQFGLLGIVCYLYILYSQFAYVMKLKVESEVKITAIGLLAVLLIGSVGNAVYTSASGLLIYIILGLILHQSDEVSE